MTDRSWKDNIISNDPKEEEVPDFKKQSETKKELKADIIEMIEAGKNSREEMMEEIDMPPVLIHQCLEELQEEDVLERLN